MAGGHPGRRNTRAHRPQGGEVQAFNHLDKADAFPVDRTLRDASDYDALVILIRDRTLTSWPSLKTDIENAHGTWIDSEVQVCRAGPNTLVTSRKPDDLPAFCATFTQVFSRQSQSA